MLSQLARLLFVVTALGPVALVFGLPRLLKHEFLSIAWVEAASISSLALLAPVLALLLLRLVRTRLTVEEIKLTSAKTADDQVVAFLVTYMLPLLAPAESSPDAAGIAIFVALLLLVLYQANLVHINPLLGLMGYHFYEVGAASGGQYLLISKVPERSGERRVRAIRLGPSVWLET